MDGKSPAPGTLGTLEDPPRLLTIHEAAQAIGARYWQLRRAVKRGDIPSYSPFNSRKLIKLHEVIAYIDACQQGARND